MAVGVAGGPPRDPQLAGLTFVQQYYNTFYKSPEKAHNYYQDFSVVSRPGPNGLMTSVTTKKYINDMILSMGSEKITVELITADTQPSVDEGLIVLATGYLTGEDNVKRKFTQTFFLALHDKVYFVLNDIFRYIFEEEIPSVETVLVNTEHEDFTEAPLNAITQPNHAPNHCIQEEAVVVEEANMNVKEIPAQDEPNSVITEKAAPLVKPDAKQNGAVRSLESATANAEVDHPKKISYASMVTKVNTTPAPVPLPAHHVNAKATKTEQNISSSPSPKGSLPSTNGTPKTINDTQEVKSYCVHVRNYPLLTMPEHVEATFKQFGAIKKGGIQVRSYKNEGTCFAFVDFENVADMEKALKATPIKLESGREITVRVKKPAVQGSNNRDMGPRRDHARNGGGEGRGNARTERRNCEPVARKTRAPVVIDEDGFQTIVYNKRAVEKGNYNQ